MDGGSATDVYASYLIMKYLENLERIIGSVTILPVANPLAFRLGAKVSPLDSKDLDSVLEQLQNVPRGRFGGVPHKLTILSISRQVGKTVSVMLLQCIGSISM